MSAMYYQRSLSFKQSFIRLSFVLSEGIIKEAYYLSSHLWGLVLSCQQVIIKESYYLSSHL